MAPTGHAGNPDESAPQQSAAAAGSTESGQVAGQGGQPRPGPHPLPGTEPGGQQPPRCAHARKLPRMLLRVGLILVLVGVGGGIGGFALQRSAQLEVLEGTLVATDPVALSLGAGEERSLWVRDFGGLGARPWMTTLRCAVADESGRPVPMVRRHHANVGSGDNRFVFAGSFAASERGKYTCSCIVGEGRITAKTVSTSVGWSTGSLFGAALALFAGIISLVGAGLRVLFLRDSQQCTCGATPATGSQPDPAPYLSAPRQSPTPRH